MSPTAKYQVFVSSTYTDLREERDQVIKAVLEMGHIPVGMEMFSAADEEQWQIIARHIEESDYYAVVVAHRIGSLVDGGVSFTRKEYEYARHLGIPCLGFVIDDQASWPADRVDRDDPSVVALREFKALIKEKPVSFWTTAEDLHGKFSIALMKAITAQPREGWVRASTTAGGPDAARELIRLSAENGALRERLREAEDRTEEEASTNRKRALGLLFGTERVLHYRYTERDDWEVSEKVTLYEIFKKVAAELVVECSIDELASDLAMHFRKDRTHGWDIVALNHVRTLMADFMTMDLVEPSERKHPRSDEREYWTLAPLGIEILKMARQIQFKSHSRFDDPGASDGLPDEGAAGDSPSAGGSRN